MARDMLAAFGKGETDAKVGADIRSAEEKIGEVESDLASLDTKTAAPRIDANAGPALASIAAVAAALTALNTQSVTRAMPAWASVMQGNLGWQADIARWRQISGPQGGQFATDAQLAALLAGLSAQEQAALPPAALAALAGGGGKKGGGGAGGLFGAALLGNMFGGGLFGMGGTGLLGLLGGLGANPIELGLSAGIGLASSAAGALLGGGLLGLGSLGVMGVGMGTDMAGIGQAAGDIKNVNSAINNLNQAIALYGRNSQQARLAQAQLNYTLAGFSPVARSAVLGAAQTAQQFHQMFNTATGAAEKIGAEILNQAMKVGEQFLPTIGKFAAKNMGIIQTALQPFFGWLQGSGLKIFTDLEQQFTAHLPTAMHAITQAIELVIKTIDVASHYTGGFITKIDQFVTKWNGVNFGRWSTEIGHLVGIFRTWEALAKAIFTDIRLAFHADVGTGTAIVQSLTQMLQKLGQWEASTRGQAKMHSIFAAHKAEILELLKLLPPLAKAMADIFLNTSPVAAGAFTTLLKTVMPLITALTSFKPTAVLIGIAMLLSHFKLLGPVLSVAGEGMKAMWALSRSAAIGLGLLSVAEDATAASSAAAAGGFDLMAIAAAVLDAVPIVALFVAIAAAIVGLIYGLYELVTHWKQVWNWIKSVAKDVWGFLKSAWDSLIAAFRPPHGALVALVAHWQQIWGTIKSVAETVWHALDGIWNSITNGVTTAWNAIVNFIGGVPGKILKGLGSLGQSLLNLATSAWNKFYNGASTVVGTVLNFVGGIAGKILNGLSTLGSGLLNLATTAWNKFSSGATNVVGTVLRFVSGIPGNILGALGSLGRGLLNLATSAWNSFFNGITTVVGTVLRFLGGLPGKIVNAIGNLGSVLFNAGVQLIQGLINGIESMAGSIGHAIGSILPGPVRSIAKHLPLIGGLLGAEGGLFTQATLKIIGEAGPELLLPLNNPSRMMALLAAAGPLLPSMPTSARAPALVGSGARSQTFNISLLGTTTDPYSLANEFAWAVRSYLRK